MITRRGVQGRTITSRDHGSVSVTNPSINVTDLSYRPLPVSSRLEDGPACIRPSPNEVDLDEK